MGCGSSSDAQAEPVSQVHVQARAARRAAEEAPAPATAGLSAAAEGAPASAPLSPARSPMAQRQLASVQITVARTSVQDDSDTQPAPANPLNGGADGMPAASHPFAPASQPTSQRRAAEAHTTPTADPSGAHATPSPSPMLPGSPPRLLPSDSFESKEESMSLTPSSLDTARQAAASHPALVSVSPVPPASSSHQTMTASQRRRMAAGAKLGRQQQSSRAQQSGSNAAKQSPAKKRASGGMITPAAVSAGRASPSGSSNTSQPARALSPSAATMHSLRYRNSAAADSARASVGVAPSDYHTSYGLASTSTFGDERSLVLREQHEEIINRRHGHPAGSHFLPVAPLSPRATYRAGEASSPHDPVSHTNTAMIGGRVSPSLSDMRASIHRDTLLDRGGGMGAAALDRDMSHTYTYHTLISHTRAGVDAEEERERALERERAEEERERHLRALALAHAKKNPSASAAALHHVLGISREDALYDKSQVINRSAYGAQYHATRQSHRPGGVQSVLHSYAADRHRADSPEIPGDDDGDAMDEGEDDDGEGDDGDMDNGGSRLAEPSDMLATMSRHHHSHYASPAAQPSQKASHAGANTRRFSATASLYVPPMGTEDGVELPGAALSTHRSSPSPAPAQLTSPSHLPPPLLVARPMAGAAPLKPIASLLSPASRSSRRVTLKSDHVTLPSLSLPPPSPLRPLHGTSS